MPYDFANGSVADADEVNANFDVVVSESNAKDARILAVEAALSSHEHHPIVYTQAEVDALLTAQATTISSLQSQVDTLSDSVIGACTNVTSRCLDAGTIEFVSGAWSQGTCTLTPTSTQSCANAICSGLDYVTESCTEGATAASCVPSANSCGPAQSSTCSGGQLTATTNTCDGQSG